MLPRRFASSLFLAFLVLPLHAAAEQRALYDISLDMDGNGTPERAVLVLNNPFDDGLNDPSRGVYNLAENETVDLYIYMDMGAASVDITKPPDLRKKDIVDRDRFGFVSKLETNGKQSLKVWAADRPGSSHAFEETLTIVYRNRQFLVAGMNTFWENPGGIGNCQYNFLTSEGYTAVGEFDDGKKAIVAKVKPIPLSQWSAATRPTICDQP